MKVVMDETTIPEKMNIAKTHKHTHTHTSVLALAHAGWFFLERQ